MWLHYVQEHTRLMDVARLNLCELITWVADGAPSLEAYIRVVLPSLERPEHVARTMLCGWSWCVVQNAQLASKHTPRDVTPFNSNVLYFHPDDTVVYMHDDRHIARVSSSTVQLSMSRGVHAWVNARDDYQSVLQWERPQELIVAL